MTAKEQIEEQIRQVLANETQAITLSEKLFSPAGLFNQLAPSEPERRQVVQTPLFRQAQARFRELQHKEAAEFAQVVAQTQAALQDEDYLLKLERR